MSSRELLGNPFLESFGADDYFLSSEDSALFFHGVKSLATVFKGKVGRLLDLCSGSGRIPSQLYLDGFIQAFTAVELDEKAFLSTREKLLQLLNNLDGIETSNTDFLAMDLFNPSACSMLLSNIQQDSVIVSANPPWVPMPQDLSSDRLKAINGGVDGLSFLPRIFELSRECNALGVCINLSSLSDINALRDILLFYGFKIDFVHMVQSFCYGDDSVEKVRHHIDESVSNNFYHYESGKRYFMILNLRLSLGGNTDIESSVERLRNAIRLEVERKPSNDSLFCKSWKLNPDDVSRMDGLV